MMKFLIKITLLGLLSQLVAAGVELSVLRRICDPKQSAFHFGSIEEVKEVLDAFQKSPDSCPESRYHNSLVELNKLLQPQYLDDICGEDTYWRIRNFHTTFINPFTPETPVEDLKAALNQKNRGLQAIPDSFKRFFILFAKQLNAQCRRDLVARLDDLTKNEILDAEYKLVNDIKNEGVRLFGYEYMKRKRRIDQLWIEMREPTVSNSSIYLHVQVKFGDILKKIQNACQSKFRPIYEELFSPVIRLANLGYTDTVNTKFEVGKLLTEKNYTRWSDVIQTCESMKYVDVIQDTSTKSALADLVELNAVMQSDAARRRVQTVTVLSDTEAEELKATIADNIAKYQSTDLLSYEPIAISHKALKVESNLLTRDPELRDVELKRFGESMRKRIHDRTDGFAVWRNQIIEQMKLMFNKYRLQYITQDQKSALGKMSGFLEKHSIAIQVINTVMGFAITTAMMYG